MYKDEDDSAWLGGFEFSDGMSRDYRGGFAMYGSDYNNELPRELGVDINDDGSVAVDGSGETNIDQGYAVGDLTKGYN